MSQDVIDQQPGVANPREAANCMDLAKTKILEAIRWMGKGRGDLPHLAYAAEQMGVIAAALRDMRVNAASQVRLVDRRGAGAALSGGKASAKKLLALQRAREALRIKRQKIKALKALRARTVGY